MHALPALALGDMAGGSVWDCMHETKSERRLVVVEIMVQHSWLEEELKWKQK